MLVKSEHKKTLYSKHRKIISQALVAIRKKPGFTQRDLAKKLGRVHSFIAHYELGEKRIDFSEFYWIYKACNASPQKAVSDVMKAFSKLE